jgi:hypothetical protein
VQAIEQSEAAATNPNLTLEGHRHGAQSSQKDAPRSQAFSPRSVSAFMQRSSWCGPFAKNLYAATAAILGILLWGSALLDWAGYTRFVLSLRWF